MTTETHTTSTYVKERSDPEYERLVRLAQLYEEHLTDACERVGVRSGNRVIDIGCGATGALLALAERIGPTGQLVGLDVNPEALAKAQAILARNGVHYAQLIHADINTVGLGDVSGAGCFDLAYCRLLLFHQPDPVATLRKVAQLVRPGGAVVIQDCVLDAELRVSDPNLPAINRWCEVMRETMQRGGASPLVPSQLGDICAAAGLQEVSQRAFFLGSGPRNAPAVLDILIRSLTSFEKAILDFGVATEMELRQLSAELAAAKLLRFRFFWGLLHNELIARVSS